MYAEFSMFFEGNMIRISKISVLILLGGVLGLQVACNGGGGGVRDVPGTDLVKDVAVDVLKDGHKEAGCGTCTKGKVCEDGKCKCPGSQVDCSGTCTTLGTNKDCSACGDECMNGKTCQDGKCKCLSSTPCVTNDDCPNGSRCNQAIKPPACQRLYCGAFGSACSLGVFCLSQACGKDSNQCVPDCSAHECGPDPVYAESCGTCQGGRVCKSGKCVCTPEAKKACCNNDICWIDSCGNKGKVTSSCPLACLNGKCVDCKAVGKANCSGTCKSLGTDTDCSACGDKCAEGRHCQDGKCVCPGLQVDCSGICKPLGTDTDCSACGDKCGFYLTHANRSDKRNNVRTITVRRAVYGL